MASFTGMTGMAQQYIFSILQKGVLWRFEVFSNHSVVIFSLFRLEIKNLILVKGLLRVWDFYTEFPISSDFGQNQNNKFKGALKKHVKTIVKTKKTKTIKGALNKPLKPL